MRQIALGILVTGLIATSASAQEPTQPRLVTSALLAGMRFDAPALAAQATPAPAPAPAPAPPAKKVKATVGADIPSSYFFRGFRQETDPEFTFQPFIDVAVAGEKASLNVGLWNSFHTGSLKDSGAGYYETDFYAAVTTGMLKTTYTAYTYPNVDNATVNELMFAVSKSNQINPSVALAFEFQRANDEEKGIYLEGGISPGIPMGDDAPVSINVPIKLGLSLKDSFGYGDSSFVYFSAGLTVGKTVGIGEIHGGVTIYGLGDSAKAVNNDNASQFIGSIGFSVGF